MDQRTIYQNYVETVSHNECPICTESLSKPTPDDPASNRTVYVSMTPCKHMFHYYCISEWCHTKGKDTCPICRRQFNLTDLTNTGIQNKSVRDSMSENSNVAKPKYSSTPPFDDIDQFASSYDEEENAATTPDSLFVNQRDSDASSLGKGIKKRRMKKTMKKTMKKRMKKRKSKGSKGRRF